MNKTDHKNIWTGHQQSAADRIGKEENEQKGERRGRM
jgi:hypothetical protein